MTKKERGRPTRPLQASGLRTGRRGRLRSSFAAGRSQQRERVVADTRQPDNSTPDNLATRQPDNSTTRPTPNAGLPLPHWIEGRDIRVFESRNQVHAVSEPDKGNLVGSDLYPVDHRRRRDFNDSFSRPG